MITIKGKTFQVSDTGLVAIRLKYLTDSEDEALTGIPYAYRGLIRRGHSGGTWEPDDNKWIVDVTYQGLVAGDPSEELDQFEISGEFREEPIEAFPERAALQSNYGAYIDNEGRIKFPETMPVKASASFGGATTSQSSQQNPLFGLTTYPVYYERASHTYVRSNVPGIVHRRKGTIITNLPSGFEYGGDAKAWFVDAPAIRKTGNCWTITENYKEIDALPAINALMALIRE